MGKNYIEVELCAAVDAGELLGYLPGSESVGAWESDGVIRLYWPEELWTPRVMEDLEIALRRLGSDSRAAGIRFAEVADRDWNALWAQSIRPVKIGERVLVRQSWNPVEVPEGVLELIIDPKRAFGTGYHATTQLLVEWIIERIRGGERVLDFGTGSGILAMTALRAGAALAIGIDDDEVAVECSRENAVLNRFGPELELGVGSIEDIGAREFDLIVANIDRKTLFACVGELKKHLLQRGRLLLSGLQEEDFAELSTVIAEAGGRVIEKRLRGEWLALETAFDSGDASMPGPTPAR